MLRGRLAPAGNCHRGGRYGVEAPFGDWVAVVCPAAGLGEGHEFGHASVGLWVRCKVEAGLLVDRLADGFAGPFVVAGGHDAEGLAVLGDVGVDGVVVDDVAGGDGEVELRGEVEAAVAAGGQAGLGRIYCPADYYFKISDLWSTRSTLDVEYTSRGSSSSGDGQVGVPAVSIRSPRPGREETS